MWIVFKTVIRWRFVVKWGPNIVKYSEKLLLCDFLTGGRIKKSEEKNQDQTKQNKRAGFNQGKKYETLFADKDTLNFLKC